MITFPTGGILLEDPSELPPVPDSVGVLIADFETSSGDRSLDSTNPWRHCQVICAGVKMDDGPVYCVPKHLLVTGWWRDVLRVTKKWQNHNVKYDMHVSTNDLSCPPPEHLEISDTLNDSKLLDSDKAFRGGYGLDALSKDWCKLDIDEHGHRMIPYLQGDKNKDFGRVPLDILGEYCCMDIVATDLVGDHISKNMPEESRGVQATEHQVTRILYEMEQRGVRVNPIDVKKTQMKVLIDMFALDKQIDELVGRPFNVSSNDQCYDVLCVQYGLPVLAWTDTSNPSFDKAALALYMQHPEAEAQRPLIELMTKYRKLSIFNSLFLSKWDELNIKGVVHATYNQSVRTGRMSCSDPNLQQLDEAAKELVVPPEGHVIMVVDASQIEFRFMGHYMQSKLIIDAYAQDPWADFHDLVAKWANIIRKAGKTLNFAMGFGQGKKATIRLLSINNDFVGDVAKRIEGDVAELDKETRRQALRVACEQAATNVYHKYHGMLPELKRTSRDVEATARRRGHVRNHYGRRRYLPPTHCHLGFPNLCQSSAGDLVKEGMVDLRKRVPEFNLVAQVHDELVGYVRKEDVCEDLEYAVVDVLNEPSRPLSVPIRWTIGWSDRSWAHAKSKEREKKLR